MANHNDGMCPGFQNRVGVTRWHVPSAFFGIYLGRGRPSRSQVFTLELFPSVRRYARNPPTGHTRARNVHWPVLVS